MPCFPIEPDRASPYYPSDRRFLEPAYIDPAPCPAMPNWPLPIRGSPKRSAWRQSCARTTLIDYASVFKLKRQALASYWTRFRDSGGEAFAPFQRFRAEGGEVLRAFAAHQAAHAEGDADFHMFLQFCADLALAAAMTAAKLPIGLYRDLAVGPAPDGAELATGREWFAANVSVGAPPDPYSDIGQVWGVPPYNPHALAQRALSAVDRIAARQHAPCRRAAP